MEIHANTTNIQNLKMLSNPRQGLTALITGANKGIGLAIVKLLSTHPSISTILLASRSKQLGESALSSLPSHIKLLILDITSKQSIIEARDSIKSQYGGLDILVNNAAIMYHGHPVSEEVATKTLATNYYGTLDMIQTFLPIMNPGSRMIQVSSEYGRRELSKCSEPIRQQFLDPNLSIEGLDELLQNYITSVKSNTWEKDGWPSSAYGISKAAVNMLIRILSPTIPYTSVTIAAVCPGWVKTDMGTMSALLTVEEGAEKIVNLCVGREDEKEKIHGRFFSKVPGEGEHLVSNASIVEKRRGYSEKITVQKRLAGEQQASSLCENNVLVQVEVIETRNQSYRRKIRDRETLTLHGSKRQCFDQHCQNPRLDNRRELFDTDTIETAIWNTSSPRRTNSKPKWHSATSSSQAQPPESVEVKRLAPKKKPLIPIQTATAELLAHQHHTILIASRNPQSVDSTVRSIRAKTSNPNIHGMTLDLGSLASVRKVGTEIKEKGIRVDTMVLNAGIQGPARLEMSEDGIEKTFATNHLGHMYLTYLLLNHLKETSLTTKAKPRIIVVSSGTHNPLNHTGTPPPIYNPAHWSNPPKYTPLRAYTNSKLATTLFGLHLSHHLPTITYDPGFISSTGLSRSIGVLQPVMGVVVRSAMRAARWWHGSPEQISSLERSAGFLAGLAADEGVVEGYFSIDGKAEPSSEARDEGKQRELVEFCEGLLRERGFEW
ncbi:Carbonyl reductase [NADPH] 3 [Phlyctochytrium planicorne]|nr:Carbonyl reductase [NADPH] 3 [Phlyctochytrium planicorne]